MPNRQLSYDVIARDLGASRTFNTIGTAAERSAATSSAAFGTSTTKIGSAFSRLGSTAAQFGVPFAGALGAVGAGLEKAEGKGRSFGSTMSRVGGTELLAAAAGLAVIGTSAVHAADSFEISHARLVTAVDRTGGSFAAAAGGVSALDDQFVKLGFNTSVTEDALSRLVTSTKDVSKAQSLLGVASDLARARGIDLATASDLLAKANQGNYRGLRALGVATTDQIKNFRSLNDVVALIESRFGGQGAAFAGTFAGKLEAVKAQANQLEVTLGSALIPKIEGVASAAVSGVQGFEHLNASTHGVLGKTVALGAAVPVAVFAIENLGRAGAAIGGQFVKAGSAVAGALGFIERAGAGTGTVITRVGSATEFASVKAAQATVAQAALADATTRSAAANARLDVAMVELAGAEQGDVAAALEVARAHDAATAALARQQVAAVTSAAATGESAAASAAATAAATGESAAASAAATAAATGESAAASAAASTTSAAAAEVAGGGAAFAGAAASLGVVAGAALIPLAGLGIGILVLRQAAAKDAEIRSFAKDLLSTGEAAKRAQAELSRIITPDLGGGATGRDLQAYGDALLSNADKAKLASIESQLHGDALQQEAIKFMGAGRAARASADDLRYYSQAPAFVQGLSMVEDHIDTAKRKLASLTKQYGAGALKTAELSAAQKRLRDDLTAVATGADRDSSASRRLADDKAKVSSAGKIVAGVEKQVQAATDGATSSLGVNAAAANTGAFAYLGLADSVKTAAQALAAISTQAFAPITASISVDTARTNVDQAIADLNAPAAASASSGGGGGSGGQTAVAADLDHAQKVLSVRDAERAVAAATSGVTDAELSLAQARRTSITAQSALTAAQQNYRTVLHGVAADSKAAKDAQDALTSAQNAAAGAKLDTGDAKRNLQQAKNDRPLARLAVHDAQATLEKDRSSGASADQITRDEIALKDAKLAATAGDEAVRRAELALSDARLSGKAKTTDLDAAQRSLNGTLHGYPPNSKEAKDAQQQLTDAQLANRQAVEGVVTATQQLQAANDNTKTSALGLRRAVADLNGQLTAAGGGGGGAASAGRALDTYQTKLDRVKTAVADAVTQIGAADLAAGHSFGHSILAEIQALEGYVAANPALAAAFSGALHELETKFTADLARRTAPVHSAGSYVRRFASGGPTGLGDPAGFTAIVHPHEFVVQRKAVEKYGPHMMEKINAGRATAADLPHFATGGLVGRSVPHLTIPRHSASVSRAAAGDVHMHFHGPVYGLSDLRAQVVKMLREETRQNGTVTGVSVSQ